MSIFVLFRIWTKAKRKEIFKIRSNRYRFIYAWGDRRIFEKVASKKISIKEIENSDIEKIVKQIVEEKLNLTSNYIFKSIPKFITLTNRLCRLVTLSIIYIVQGLKNTDFEVVGSEIEFKMVKNIDL